MITENTTVDEIIQDVLNSQRDLTVENAVDEYILAEKDLLIEAHTYADSMADLEIDDDMNDAEVDAFIDACITEDIEDEEDLFEDTLGENDFYDDEDVVEDVEDVLCPYEDIEALLDDDEIDSLIANEVDYEGGILIWLIILKNICVSLRQRITLLQQYSQLFRDIQELKRSLL